VASGPVPLYLDKLSALSYAFVLALKYIDKPSALGLSSGLIYRAKFVNIGDFLQGIKCARKLPLT
jgi:hypothetical protein